MTKLIARLTVIYDGDCPFCSSYVRHIRLRDVVHELQYINARDGGDLVVEALQNGFNIDEGMLVRVDGTCYHGAAAVQVLARLTSPVNLFNRITATLLTSHTLSRIVYPILRFGRHATLRLLGKQRLGLQPKKFPKVQASMMVHAKRYRAYCHLAPALICTYFALVLFAQLGLHENEIFPFFSWSLFSNSAGERTAEVIRFDSINGKPLPVARLYYEMSDTFVYARERDSTVEKAIARLAGAIEHRDQETISRMRKMIEGRFMAEIKSAEYAVMRLTYDPIKRYRTGEIKDTIVLATFKKVSDD